jgi:hypothetical protein
MGHGCTVGGLGPGLACLRRNKDVPSGFRALRKYSILHRDCILELSTIVPTTTSLNEKMALVKSGSAPDYTIKPEAAAAPIDTSDWPLLLKNYSDCMQRSLIRSSKYLH